jgi:adenine deaminase
VGLAQHRLRRRRGKANRLRQGFGESAGAFATAEAHDEHEEDDVFAIFVGFAVFVAMSWP